MCDAIESSTGEHLFKKGESGHCKCIASNSVFSMTRYPEIGANGYGKSVSCCINVAREA